MIFSSFQFLFFLLVVLFLLIVLPRQSWRKLTLLIASYIFYGAWDYRFLALILISTIVDSVLAKAIYKVEERHKKPLLLLSVAVNLGILGFFKYFNFFIESASFILSSWGLNVSTLNIILPVGISFYTFQTMSYTIDVYRGKLKPANSFFDFALFVAFFPQLVAGPIVRAADFLPQLEKPVQIRGHNIWVGLQIFTVGLFKKLILADNVALFVDQVFANSGYYSSTTVWLGVLAYAIQIYCDFSGYSDMAIGTARMLGFHFERNFWMPYISTSVTEFWRRWHISLSSWLRDYLYIALGGNRKGHLRTYVNLMITMLLGGLWHGASWNFVIWGGAHGLALAVHRLWSRRFKPDDSILGRFEAWLATFLFVAAVWVLFRATDTATMLTVYRKMLFIDPAGADWYYHYFFVAAILMIIGHVAGIMRKKDELIFFETPYSFPAAFATVTTLLIIYLFAPTNTNPFIYFQF